MVQKYKSINLILLFLLILDFQVYPQNFLSKKGMWEFNSGADINIPKESSYNYYEYLPDPYSSYFIDEKVKPVTVATSFINLGRNELLYNNKDKHIIRIGYSTFFYKKKYQLKYSGIDPTRYGASSGTGQESPIHNGKETYTIKNFGINISLLYFYKISKSIFLYNKFETNFADPYINYFTFSDTAYSNNGNIYIKNFDETRRIRTFIAFPFPTLTLNYYTGVCFALSSDFTITPNIGIQLIRKDFDKMRDLHYYAPEKFYEGTYHVNKHYLFMRAGISLSFNFS